MNFIRKTQAFLKFYFELALANKINLIFTLVFPIVYQLMSVKVAYIDNLAVFINATIPMIAYIIVSTVLNGITMAIIATRNSGYIKAYYFASGSRWAIYVANLIVQLIVTVLEVFLFTLVTMILYGYFSISLLLILLIITVISFIIISFEFNMLFLLPIRQASLSILSTTLLLGFLVLFNFQVSEIYSQFLIFNPYNLIKFCLLDFLNPTIKTSILLIVAGIVLLLIGFYGYNNLDLQNRGKES